MANRKITLKETEELLEKLGYSKEQVRNFRDGFGRVLLQEIGLKVYEDLSEKQREEMNVLTKKILDGATISPNEIPEYLKDYGSKKIKSLVKTAASRMLKDFLIKISLLASDEQFKIIEDALQ